MAGWSSTDVPVLLKTKGLLRSRIEVPLAFTPALLYIVFIAPDFTAAVTIWIVVQKWRRGGSCRAAAGAGDLTAGESPLQGLLWRAAFTHPTLGTSAAFCWWWCFCFYFFSLFFFFVILNEICVSSYSPRSIRVFTVFLPVLLVFFFIFHHRAAKWRVAFSCSEGLCNTTSSLKTILKEKEREQWCFDLQCRHLGTRGSNRLAFSMSTTLKICRTINQMLKKLQCSQHPFLHMPHSDASWKCTYFEDSQVDESESAYNSASQQTLPGGQPHSLLAFLQSHGNVNKDS